MHFPLVGNAEIVIKSACPVRNKLNRCLACAITPDSGIQFIYHIYYTSLVEKQDLESPKLTQHDKHVLRKIIEHAKTPDSDIASTMGISPQAVFKIRNKLERLGIIKGYVPIIDYKKVGIRVVALLIIGISPETWAKYSDSGISERIRRIPHIMAAYRVADVRATHVLLLGFRDTFEKERYVSHMQTKMSGYLRILQIYTFSTDKIIVQSPLALLHHVVNDKEAPVHEFLPTDKKVAKEFV